MEIRYPDYYKTFSCLAGACPDSCCQEWEVDVDPVAAEHYRRLPGPLGERLRQVLRDGEDGWASLTITEDRRCPMWRQDGLCRIQAELSHDDLCETCRNFPRLRHDYGDFAELGLELSCPEAARLILANPHARWITEETPGGEAPEYEEYSMNALRASREYAVNMALDETMPVNRCLAVVLLYAYVIHYATDMRELVEFDLEYHLEKFRGQKRDVSLGEFWDPYWNLEILTDRWKALLKQGAVDAPWDPKIRALLRYFIDRYWLQAISDGELALRMKFAVVSCLVIQALGGELARTAQLYSKEIENSDENVDALLDAMETNAAVADLRLLNLLLK